MKECTHSVCRYARSDELIRDALKARRESRGQEADRIAVRAIDVHLGPVPCRMFAQPAKLKTTSSDLFSLMQSMGVDLETGEVTRPEKGA